MSHLTIVGHFSSGIIAAWIVWLLWVSWQVRWYRGMAGDLAPAAVPVATETAAVDSPADPARAITLRAPDPASRSMKAVQTPRRDAAPLEEDSGPPDDVNPS